ncbi:MAG: hypothetical protein WBR26_23860 [Candidatus Acidiferrum sp.]
MNPSPAPLDPLLVTIVLATLAIGLPIVMVLSIRFLWDRHLHLGRSKELEKLIWQLHRIASAMEHQMNLSFPAVQPGTEDPRDLAYLQQIPAQPKAASQPVVLAVPAAAAPATPQATVQQPVAPPPATQQPAVAPAAAEQPAVPPPLVQPVSPEVPRRAGVNSMFDL